MACHRQIHNDVRFIRMDVFECVVCDSSPQLVISSPLLMLMSSVYNVYVARKSPGQSLLPTLPQLSPIILFFAAHYAWLLSPYSHILEKGDLMRVGLTMTFVFGRMTTKIILVLPPITSYLPTNDRHISQNNLSLTSQVY